MHAGTDGGQTSAVLQFFFINRASDVLRYHNTYYNISVNQACSHPSCPLYFPKMCISQYHCVPSFTIHGPTIAYHLCAGDKATSTQSNRSFTPVMLISLGSEDFRFISNCFCSYRCSRLPWQINTLGRHTFSYCT